MDKKAFVISLLLLTSVYICLADNGKNISITFSIDDFSLSTDSNGVLSITSKKHVDSYGLDPSEPGLPLIPIRVFIPNGYSYSNSTVSTTRTLLLKNVVISTNPEIIPTKDTVVVNSNNIPTYEDKVYPTSVGSYICTTCIDGYTILNFFS